jgi:hypothetical protein
MHVYVCGTIASNEFKVATSLEFGFESSLPPCLAVSTVNSYTTENSVSSSIFIYFLVSRNIIVLYFLIPKLMNIICTDKHKPLIFID